jgi:hypothetical protein
MDIKEGSIYVFRNFHIYPYFFKNRLKYNGVFIFNRDIFRLYKSGDQQVDFSSQ